MDFMLEINNFLGQATPQAWVDSALDNIPTLLVDHAHCEKKAASTALNLMFRYVDHPQLLQQLSRLAREELRHFEKVLAILQKRDINYCHLSPARYAEGLRRHLSTHEPQRLIDILIISSFIEARSCERFALLVPHLDDELARFYQSLLSSEARHFKNYLSYAEKMSEQDISERVVFFRQIENQLVTQSDKVFRFHSGPVELALTVS